MDSSNVSSIDSKTGHSNSLGLLDLQDVSLELNAKSKAVKEKPPPIPNKTKKPMSLCNDVLGQPNMLEQTQDLEATVASIHLNESDLKELDDEFTFDEGDEEAEESEGSHQEKVENLKKSDNFPESINESVNTSNGLVKRFDLIGNNTSSDLLNESANILMLSNEYSKLINKSDMSSFNYESMDKINEMMANTTTDKSMNLVQVNKDSETFNNSSFIIEPNNINDFHDGSMINKTMDNNQSSLDRINQLVMQSVERAKRTALKYNCDEFINNLKNLDSKNPNMNEKSSHRFSSNSIKTQCSKFNNDTMNSMSIMTTPGRNSTSNNPNSMHVHTLTTPQAVSCDQTDTSLNRTTDNTINFSSTERDTDELASIYFKPSAVESEMTPTTSKDQSLISLSKSNSGEDKSQFTGTNTTQFYNTDHLFQSQPTTNDDMLKHQQDDNMFGTIQNFPSNDDSMFKPQKNDQTNTNHLFQSQPTTNDDSMFKPQKNDQTYTNHLFQSQPTTNDDMLKHQQDDSMFGTIQNFPSNDDSMFKPQKNDQTNTDHLFKPQLVETSQESFLHPSTVRMNDSIFGSKACDTKLSIGNDSMFRSNGNNQFSASDESTSSFKSGNAFMNDLENAEEENRKEFASNNLTVLSTSNCLDKTEKWWNQSVQQTSKLEISRASNSFEKKVFAVDDYFNQKSEMPNYLADKDHGVNIPDDIPKTTKQQNGKEETTTCPKEKQTKISDDMDFSNFTLSSNTILSTGRPTGNFSFTLNSSETGSFIQRKDVPNEGQKMTPQTPFQITKMLNKKTEADAAAAALSAAAKETSVKTNPSNLKTIGEELDRVSNRLAHSNTQNTDFKVPEVPKLPVPTISVQSVKTSEALAPMDETISSINTTTNVTGDLKLNSKANGNRLVKPYGGNQAPVGKTNMNNSSGHYNKQKLNSGSLTSTPSKLKGSSMKSSNTKEQKSEINLTNSNSTIASTSNTTNYYFNQDSFITSFPERTNDSTLVGNHHNQCHQRSSSKKTPNVKSTSSSKLKNAEIQTTPVATNTLKLRDTYASAQLNTSTTVTTTMSSTTTADIHEKITSETNSDINNKMLTRSSLSSSDLANSALASLLTNINAMNNSNPSTTSNQLHPVMFLSLQQISSLVNETNQKSMHESNLSSSSVNRLSGSQSQLGTKNSTNQTNISPNFMHSTANHSFNKFELPNVELNKAKIDFGQIAEGCHDTCRMLATITNPSVLSQSQSYLQIEFDDSSDWSIENCGRETTSKYDDLKPQLSRTLYLHTSKVLASNQAAKNILKLDLTTNYFEFFVHLDTKEITYFKDLIYQQQLLKQQMTMCDSRSPSENESPLLVTTSFSIYYCVGNNENKLSDSENKKYLLNRVNLKYVLGFARLKTSNSLDVIEFEIYIEDYDTSETQVKKGYLKSDDGNDIDKTLTSINDSMLSNSSVKNLGKNLEKLIPLSNAGNIDIDVNCYFREDLVEIDTKCAENPQRLLKFKAFELRIEEFVINLQANAKQKKYARLVLIKLLNELSSQQNFLDIHKPYKFIVEVKPDGFQYEIPVKIRTIEKSVPRLQLKQPEIKESVSHSTNASLAKSNIQKIKVATSKAILFFGRSLNSLQKTELLDSELLGLTAGLTIKNLNDFQIRYQIVTYSIGQSEESTHNKSLFNLFKFAPEMYDSNECANRGDTSKMTRLVLDLKAQEEICIKLRFDPSAVDNAVGASLVQNGVLKISSTGFSERFNVYLVGFLNNSILEFDRVTKLKVDIKNMEPLRIQKQLYRNNLSQSNYNLQVIKSKGTTTTTTTTNCKQVLKKSMRLKNRSSNSKLLVYPVCYVLKQGVESICQLTDANCGNRAEKVCMAEIDGLSFCVKLGLIDSLFFQNEQLVWYEMCPDETVVMNVEFELLHCYANSRSVDFERKLHQNFNIGLFWIESDLNMYCIQGIKQLESNATSIFNTQKHEFALNGEAFRLENFLNKIITNNFITSPNQMLLNMSTASSASLADLSKSKVADSSILFNNSLINPSKSKIKRDDYYKLLCKSFKCSLLNISTLSIDHSIDESFDISDCSQLSQIESNNSKSESPCFEGLNAKAQEPWSCDIDMILIHNLRIDSNLANFSHKLVLSNNGNRKLSLNFAYRQACLEIAPNCVVLKPYEKCEVRVTPRKEGINKLPWNGVINITGGRFKKEVKVSLLSTPKPMPSGLPPCRKSISSSTLSSSQINKSVFSTSISQAANNFSLTASTPICTKSAMSMATSGCTTLEQGTLVSEITQNTLDSMSLTPLISASFISFASTSSKCDLSSSLTKSKFLKTKSKSIDSIDDSESSIIKLLHFGNYAQVLFPPLVVTKRKSYDLTLINPTSSCVNWKAYSTVHPFLRGNTEQGDVSLPNSEYQNVFMFTPQAGVISTNQKQTIKIEFSPVEVLGVFTQYWEIDTYTDTNGPLAAKHGKSNKALSYNCKLVLSGRSINTENKFGVVDSVEDVDNHLRLNTRILKSKQNALNVQFKTNDLDHSLANRSNMSRTSDFKENTCNPLPDKHCSYSSGSTASASFSGSLLSASTNSSLNSVSTKTVILKYDQVVLPDVAPGQISKNFLVINNREERPKDLVIMNVMDPFKCKYRKIKINQKHYMKVPIEFKPRIKGEYVEKILIRVEGYENTLSCLVKGKCV